MATVRTAEAHWEGSLMEGQGEVELVSSGVGSFEVTWASRAEQANGKTSPEELIAAAHSTCFSMALSLGLETAGLKPTSIKTSADVSLEKQGAGFAITTIALTCEANVPGASADQFQKIAEETKKNCPVSKALAGVNIILKASLAR